MKNLGFKLWRWVGRKCGWYVEPPLSPCSRLTQFLVDEQDKFQRSVMREWSRSPVGWTRPIQTGAFPEGLGVEDKEK